MTHSASRTTAVVLDPARGEQLPAFAEQFRPVFPRADQFQHFQAYLAGLLAPGGRKNVQGVAADAAGYAPAGTDLVQALQHFVTRSPWDAGRLFAACRRARTDHDPRSVWVVHDAVFPKKGRHSAGVHRQFARALGRKVNCQIAVVLSRLGPGGYAPLAARLYLPGHWLRESGGLAERAVPEEYRRPTSKAEIALAMVDEVRAEGSRPGLGSLFAEDGYAAAHDLIDGLPARGLVLCGGPDAAETVSTAHRRFDDLRATLGLDHFEGRTWVGWHHHVSLVFAAHTFALLESPGPQPRPAAGGSSER